MQYYETPAQMSNIKQAASTGAQLPKPLLYRSRMGELQRQTKLPQQIKDSQQVRPLCLGKLPQKLPCKT